MHIFLYKNILFKRINLALETYEWFQVDMKIIVKLKEKSNLFFFCKKNYLNLTFNKMQRIIGFEKDDYILNLLISLCMRKGKKQIAFKTVLKSFCLLRSFLWIDVSFILKLITIQSESLFTLQRYMRGKREIVIPRFVSFRKKSRLVLRMLVKYARDTAYQYSEFYISLAHAIVEYSISENNLLKTNREENQLAHINKYSLFRKKKRRRKKVRILRTVQHWKKK